MQEVINIKNIRNHIEANTWQEAIQEAGNLLIEDNKITQDYVESMIHSVYEMGPYMVLMPGFALVHAAPSEAVKESSISLITLKKPVTFGSPNDPVSVILCLACVDKTSHMNSLQVVAEKLMVEGMIQELANCNSSEELYSLINHN